MTTGLILTRPKGGGGGSANAFETLTLDTGSVTAVGADTLIITGGTAIDTAGGGSPQTVTISVDPTEINLGDLGDVTLGSPVPVGYVLSWDGTDWVPADPTAAASGISAGKGIDITSAGSPPISVISLDVCSLDPPPASPATLDLTDEIAVCDGTANYRYTIQDIVDILPLPTAAWTTINGDTGSASANSVADTVDVVGGTGISVAITQEGSPGVDTVTITNTASAPGNLQLVTINGQPTIVFQDTTRLTGSPPAGKLLSVAEQSLVFTDNVWGDDGWLNIGNAADADSSFVADFDGTIVFATGHTENTNGNSKTAEVYVNGTNVVTAGTLSGAGEQTFTNTTIDVDFNQGDKIRVRGGSTGGAVLDTVVKLTVKWRG